YPVSTLEPDMDLEADLGIDSIKRVEILGALQDRLPDLPPLAPETAGELRTLGQIVAHLAPAAPAPASAPVATPAAAVASAPVATPAVAPAPPAVSGDPRVQQALFEVVADKTGYPVSTLEPDMDLEADLGI
ncbi:MAG TPA: phosphopantetheine-binding protein, partial [Roseiflexaceae bacterium]|nr:phosphopantetheine-binding protein [Roseiflexaceae bacterium]